MTKNVNIHGNVDFDGSSKKYFTVGGNEDNVIEFDPTDMHVIDRLTESIKIFNSLEDDWKKLSEIAQNDIPDADDAESMIAASGKYVKQSDEIERKIRETINYIFDSDIADALLGNSSSLSPINGKYKFEHLIEKVLECYEEHIKREAPKFEKRKLQKYTSKYKRK